MTLRLLTAFLTAPIVGIAAVAVVGGLFAAHASTAGTIHAFWFLLLFGAPGAYALELVVGGALYKWLRERGRLRFSIIAPAAMVLGSVAFAIPWCVVWNQWTLTGVATAAGIGGVGGLASGIWFCFVGTEGTGPA